MRRDKNLTWRRRFNDFCRHCSRSKNILPETGGTICYSTPLKSSADFAFCAAWRMLFAWSLSCSVRGAFLAIIMRMGLRHVCRVWRQSLQRRRRHLGTVKHYESKAVE